MKGKFLLKTFSCRYLAILLGVILGLGSVTVCTGQKKQKLERGYRDWLKRDVAYIITKEEHDAFLRLTIAYADAHFGIGSGTDGWRTDRGRTYITLGPPQQKQVLRNSPNLYPIEIWFYGNANPALPPFFYVMFYQREGSGDYRFYSPYTDGPDKLITGVEAVNSRRAALKMIRDSAGSEVARVSLSLLPDEPVDLEGRNLDIVTFPARDSHGLTRLDYALRLRSPSDLSMTEENDGSYRYSVEVRVRVFGPGNKLIFTQQKSATDSFTKKRLDAVKDKVFGYEGSLPLPPGKYHLDFQFTDWSKKSAFHTVREIVIPVPANQGMVVPSVLPFLSAEVADPGLADLMPFTVGGVRFTPMPSSTPSLAPDTNLQVVFQIWAPPKDPRTNVGKKLDVEYAFGNPAVPGSISQVKDEVDMEQFDATGSLVTGKKLSLDQKSIGSYILTVSVTDPETKQSGFGTMNFKILDGPQVSALWDVVEPGIAQDAEKGMLDQQRALCYWALGQLDEARVWFRRALQFDHSNDVARARLVDAYFSRKDYAAVASLYSDVGVSEQTDSETLLRIATSLEKQGITRQAITLIENALQSRSGDGLLYLALAQYYSELGNPQKAAELTKKGKSFLATDLVKH